MSNTKFENNVIVAVSKQLDYLLTAGEYKQYHWEWKDHKILGPFKSPALAHKALEESVTNIVLPAPMPQNYLFVAPAEWKHIMLQNTSLKLVETNL